MSADQVDLSRELYQLGRSFVLAPELKYVFIGFNCSLYSTCLAP